MENEVIEEKVVKAKKFHLKEYVLNNRYMFIALAGLIVCLIVFSILPPIMTGAVFWSSRVLSRYVEQLTVLLILAVGATFVYSMGSMDISVGYQVGVLGTVFIMVANGTGSIIVGILTMLSLGILSAIFNAVVGAYAKLPATMSSVILMRLFSGLITTMYQDNGVANYIIDKDLSFASSTGFRVVSIILLIALGAYILNYTKVGKKARAIGANKKAADLAGAQYLKTRILSYILFSIFLVAGAFFLIARKNGLGEQDSTGYQMEIMIMLLMGGMPLSGGMKSKLANAIIGAFTYVLISLGLSICGVSAQYIFFIKALIFAVIVVLTCRKPGDVLPR